jgi:hypothetical protein
MPRPTALPATDVPAPREVTEVQPRSRQRQPGDLVHVPGTHDGERRAAVQGGVGGVHARGPLVGVDLEAGAPQGRLEVTRRVVLELVPQF